MDFWQRARSFAEDAAKKSQELTQGIASANLADVVSEASKRSKELAAEASKKSKELAAEALKRADQITAHIPPAATAAAALSGLVDSSASQSGGVEAADLEMYGVADELREFVKEITMNTFRDFPLEGENYESCCLRVEKQVMMVMEEHLWGEMKDDAEMSDVPTVSNVRQDLTEWQERHAKLVLLTVKDISKLRYQLCPRVMKERKFWRIYFILVNSHVAPYEHRYNEDLKLKATEKVKDNEVKEVSSGATPSKTDEGSKQKSSTQKSPVSEQDLDVFLLGDLDDGDDGPDDGDNGFDDDFDKL
ncbi:BSD domain-containing protein [Striga asiatica]|uniref:BSD domain-containing protein n=1 Tax=Striga asiatica TaxID=4170 RepID=A0A5A7QAJ4_STRAF|nr:BSD domain-containing protein [Striga asiatica]